MRKTCLRTLPSLIAFIVWSQTAFGQGTVFFANRLSSTVFVPAYMADGKTPVSGPGFSAQLYAGTNASKFHAVGTPRPFRTGAGAGSWAGVDVAISWAKPGDSVALQVRVWDNGGGTLSSYDAAYTAGRLAMKSAVFTSLPLGGVNSPATSPNIVGNRQAANNLQSFIIPPAHAQLRLLTPAIQSRDSFAFSVPAQGQAFVIHYRQL